MNKIKPFDTGQLIVNVEGCERDYHINIQEIYTESKEHVDIYYEDDEYEMRRRRRRMNEREVIRIKKRQK